MTESIVLIGRRNWAPRNMRKRGRRSNWKWFMITFQRENLGPPTNHCGWSQRWRDQWRRSINCIWSLGRSRIIRTILEYMFNRESSPRKQSMMPRLPSKRRSWRNSSRSQNNCTIMFEPSKVWRQASPDWKTKKARWLPQMARRQNYVLNSFFESIFTKEPDGIVPELDPRHNGRTVSDCII